MRVRNGTKIVDSCAVKGESRLNMIQNLQHRFFIIVLCYAVGGLNLKDGMQAYNGRCEL